MKLVAFTSLVLTFIASKAYADGNLLNNYPEFPPLPTVIQTSLRENGVDTFTNATQAGDGALDLNVIQGDILVGMRKDKELFSFFHINNPDSFKKKMTEQIAVLITSTAQLISPKFQPASAITLAFSATGLKALNVAGDLGDAPFASGQFADATNLGDPGTNNWVQAFKGTNIHGVFLIASKDWANVNATKAEIASIFGSDVTFVHELQGQARPGAEAGHEHFGFMDGISQPAVKGFDNTTVPGQTVIDPGFFLFGEAGDSLASSRPSWAKDGTIMAFRQLQQLVPEFDKFVADQAAANGISADLLGARIVGRWKSGAPVDLSPTVDDPVLAADPKRNNNFDFSHPNSDILTDQTRCPFTAHIRKTAPRADFDPVNTQNHIIRAGIPYGPEVSAKEAASKKTTQERGLAFISYQTSLDNGFRFLQMQWANNPNFFFNKNITAPGADPLVGQLNGNPRPIVGLIPQDANEVITFPTQHVVSRGGEYFFVPSIKAIETGFTN
jgi:Dyp-type peroxidase family